MENQVRFQRQRMNELVLTQLLDWIMDGTLVMGQKLNTEKIAQELGVSRMPVREALSSLEKLGLAEDIPYVGYRVIEMDYNSIHELYLIRQAIEPTAAYYACRKMQPKDVDALEVITKALEDTIKKESFDPKKIFVLNRDFHFAMYQYSGMKMFCDMIRNVWNHLSFYKLNYGRMLLTDDHSARGIVQEHQEFIRLLRAGDADGLKAAVERTILWHTSEVPGKLTEMLVSPGE